MPQQRKPFTADDVRKHGALKKGAILGGPEPYGCFNSGFRPTLGHVNTPDHDIYVVGPDLAAAEVRKSIMYAAMRLRVAKLVNAKTSAEDIADQKTLRQQVFRQKKDPSGTRTCYAFRSKGPAITKFVELCNKMIEMNAKDRAEHSDALKDARSSDPATAIAGALRAADF